MSRTLVVSNPTWRKRARAPSKMAVLVWRFFSSLRPIASPPWRVTGIIEPLQVFASYRWGHSKFVVDRRPRVPPRRGADVEPHHPRRSPLAGGPARLGASPRAAPGERRLRPGHRPGAAGALRRRSPRRSAPPSSPPDYGSARHNADEGEPTVHDPLQYEGTHAVVTGCASGMGAATAAILTELGATVTGLDVQDRPTAWPASTRSTSRTRRRSTPPSPPSKARSTRSSASPGCPGRRSRTSTR